MLLSSLIKKAIGINKSKYTDEMCLTKVVLCVAAISTEVRMIAINKSASFLYCFNMGINPKHARRYIGLDGNKPGVAFFVPTDQFQFASRSTNNLQNEPCHEPGQTLGRG